MLPNTNAGHFRLKAAIRDLIAAAGGIERAAEICTLGKSTVGRWQDADARDFPNIWHVRMLECECGRADISRVMAELAGLDTGRADSPDGKACLMASHAEAVTHAAALMSEGAMAFSDSLVTPAEASSMDRAAQRLEEAVASYRQVLAGVKAAGGFTIVKGGAA